MQTHLTELEQKYGATITDCIKIAALGKVVSDGFADEQIKEALAAMTSICLEAVLKAESSSPILLILSEAEALIQHFDAKLSKGDFGSVGGLHAFAH